MTTFGRDDDLKDARFEGADLRGARFVSSDLAGVVMRGVEVSGVEVDSPWLDEGEGLVVNGVDVADYVEAELARRFPGREQKRAADPAGLRAAWAAVESAWATALQRAAAMPAGTVEVSVAGEWSFVQTLRHLVLATDMWLGKAILRLDEPFHPLGLINTEGADDDGHDLSVFTDRRPTFEEVLEVRAERMAMVRDFLAGVTDDMLAESRPNPHSPDYAETVRSCLHTILAEEWEHLRYASRDLDAIESQLN
jgi:hypothetical protein